MTYLRNKINLGIKKFINKQPRVSNRIKVVTKKMSEYLFKEKPIKKSKAIINIKTKNINVGFTKASNKIKMNENYSNNIEYIYLLQEREFVESHKNVFKIGKSTQENLQRFKQYPKGSLLLLQSKCSDCHTCETELLQLFKKSFIKRSDIGNEYFEGDSYDMINKINKVILDNRNIDSKNKEFYIEKIIAHRGDFKNDKLLEFHVKWLGFSSKNNTWEPFANLKYTKSLDEYLLRST
jgi:hypothetical protein